MRRRDINNEVARFRGRYQCQNGVKDEWFYRPKKSKTDAGLSMFRQINPWKVVLRNETFLLMKVRTVVTTSSKKHAQLARAGTSFIKSFWIRTAVYKGRSYHFDGKKLKSIYSRSNQAY
jgi:hypothetical protein